MPRLLIQRGFTTDQIVTYDTEEENIEMLSKGSAPDGVVAVIDETPYLNVFFSKHCNKPTRAIIFSLHLNFTPKDLALYLSLTLLIPFLSRT